MTTIQNDWGGSMYGGPFYQRYGTETLSDTELEHFGVKGMKWGVRRYQNADGTLTEAGKKQRQKDTKRFAKNLKTAQWHESHGEFDNFLSAMHWRKAEKYINRGLNHIAKMHERYGDKAFDEMDAFTQRVAENYLRESGITK